MRKTPKVAMYLHCSKEERAIIRAAAEHQGMKLGVFVLRAVLKEVERIKQSMEAES